MPSKRGAFYVVMAIFMTTLVLAGFWPTYFGVLLSGSEYDRHWIFHIHAVVFMGWMAALIGQTSLVARRRTKTHMKLGVGGFVWAVAVFVMGVVVSFVLMFQLFDDGAVTSWPSALWGASAPLVDITQFAILIALGWTHRKKLDFHKRYMALATVAILPAATARMGYLLGPWSLEVMFAVLAGLLIAYDFRVQSRIHIANLVGLLILLPRVLLNISYRFIG